MKNIFALTAVIFISACSGGVTRSVTPLPGVESTQAKTYVTRCGGCHAVPHPQRLSFQGWKNVLPVMEQRMRERSMTVLSHADKQAILGYLKAHSR